MSGQGADYVCPQCGPDPRGGEVHAQDRHTIDGLLGLPDDEPQVCRRPPRPVEIIGAACPDCGHTNLVHPKESANPALTACVICELQEVIRAAG